VSRVFVDTSAVVALLVSSDHAHPPARRAFEGLRARSARLTTTSYVLVETYALLERRFGLEPVRAFRLGFAPLLDVVWVDREVHEEGLDLLLHRSARGLSLVDAVSFVAMRAQRVDEAFAFDRHFEAEGFRLVS
jgi:predicted nucleic acid-binding protein